MHEKMGTEDLRHLEQTPQVRALDRNIMALLERQAPGRVFARQGWFWG